ncbi:MAG: hypothetical protein PHI02_06970 [Sulfurovaceae bacterium]|nr:hypothetical protein [Sulfurovaceae bacterium]
MNYGINGSISVDAARPISVESTTPIALVGDSDVGDTGVQFFGNAELALAEYKTAASGTLRLALEGISAQGVSCPIILGTARNGATAKADIIDIIDGLSTAEGVTGYRPDLIVAPTYSFDVDVGVRMDAVASKLWATAVVDNLGANETAMLEYADNFASRFVLMYGPHAKFYDTLSQSVQNVAPSAAIAAMIARTDGEVPFGFADSISNRVFKGYSGTDRIIDYADGQDCEARRLRNAGIGSIVADEGWRTYGFETTDIDPIWQSLERVRTFYKALTAIKKASKWARDRRANELISVRKSIDAFMRELKGNNVALGFEIFFDPIKNTNATVTAGKFYLTVKWQNMPLVRELNIEMVYVDSYGDVLLNIINGGN